MNRIFSVRKAVTQFVSKAMKISPEKTYIGKDLDGNSYYEIRPQKYFWGLKGTTKDQEVRMIMTPSETNAIEAKHVKGKVTKEWDAWLKKIRTEPPKLDELMRNMTAHNRNTAQGSSQTNQFVKKSEKLAKEENKHATAIESEKIEDWHTEKK